MKQSIIEKAEAWVKNDYFDSASKKEIQQLIDSKDEKELTERFYKDLSFGTGGIRSIIGQGLNRINKYTVRKATQALAETIKTQDPIDGKYRVAISYDNRRFSFDFAKEAAGVFAANGIHSYIYERLNPVPLLSFSVRHHKAHAGVMVTASHNPPEYNGYKVYWSDGAQVTPPNDQNIIKNYYDIKDFSTISHIDFERGLEEGLIHWVGKDVEDAYFNITMPNCLRPELCKEKGKDLKIIFTPIHGTGLIPCSRVLNDMGLENFIVVPDQAEPDENFPTVKSPNPENPEALEKAVSLMKKENADIVFGTDPDTDRLGIALPYKGQVVYPNGNQIGLLMLNYILETKKEKNELPKNPYFINTIVTTPLQKVIANKFGVDTECTLTGFKWICSKMKQIEENEPHRNFVFSTEESFGYMNHNHVRDKDGVASVALMAEIALWYKTRGMNLIEALDELYEKFGYSKETLLCLNYYGKEGAEKIDRIMDRFRSTIKEKFQDDPIESIEDYEKGELYNLDTKSSQKFDFPSSNVLCYNLKSGARICVRPSGTEPKIKFYIMINENSGPLEEKKKSAESKIEKALAFIKKQAELA